MRHLLLAVIVLCCIGIDLGSKGFAEGANCVASGQFLFSSVAKVKVAKLFFRNNSLKPTRAFVVKGNFVAVRNVKDYGTCVLFINQNGQETVGWLQNNGLEMLDDADMMDMPNRWQLKRGQQTLMLELLTPIQNSNRHQVRLTANTRSSSWLSGVLTLTYSAFTLEVKLNSKTSCSLNGVFLNGFMRIFSETKACSVFAGIYKQVKR
jgi:hypothetical protein